MSPVVESIIAERIVKSILAGATVNIDSNVQGTFVAVRYFISMIGGTKAKSFDLSLVDDNSQIKDTIFGKVGRMAISVNTELVGSDIILSIKNNEAFTIDVEAFKFISG